MRIRNTASCYLKCHFKKGDLFHVSPEVERERGALIQNLQTEEDKDNFELPIISSENIIEADETTTVNALSDDLQVFPSQNSLEVSDLNKIRISDEENSFATTEPNILVPSIFIATSEPEAEISDLKLPSFDASSSLTEHNFETTSKEQLSSMPELGDTDAMPVFTIADLEPVIPDIEANVMQHRIPENELEGAKEIEKEEKPAKKRPNRPIVATRKRVRPTLQKNTTPSSIGLPVSDSKSSELKERFSPLLHVPIEKQTIVEVLDQTIKVPELVPAVPANENNSAIFLDTTEQGKQDETGNALQTVQPSTINIGSEEVNPTKEVSPPVFLSEKLFEPSEQQNRHPKVISEKNNAQRIWDVPDIDIMEKIRKLKEEVEITKLKLNEVKNLEGIRKKKVKGKKKPDRHSTPVVAKGEQEISVPLIIEETEEAKNHTEVIGKLELELQKLYGQDFITNLLSHHGQLKELQLIELKKQLAAMSTEEISRKWIIIGYFN